MYCKKLIMLDLSLMVGLEKDYKNIYSIIGGRKIMMKLNDNRRPKARALGRGKMEIFNEK